MPEEKKKRRNEKKKRKKTGAYILLLKPDIYTLFLCSVRGTGGSCYFQVLSVVTFNTLLATIAGIVVHYELDESDTTMYIVKNGLLLWVILFGQILFLIAKVRLRIFLRLLHFIRMSLIRVAPHLVYLNGKRI